jgi:hypothetical protein
MTSQLFPIGASPQIVITQSTGNLIVRTWTELAIRSETEGAGTELQQEGDTLAITNSTNDIELWIPAIIYNDVSPITDISITHHKGNVLIEEAGHVMLKDIDGDVMVMNSAGNIELENISGVARIVRSRENLHVVSVPTLLVSQGIRGDASLSAIVQVESDFIGGNLVLEGVGTAEIIAVSGDLEVMHIGASLRCTTVGGDCKVQHSPHAQIGISNVAGDFHMEGMVNGRMGNVGGNLDLQATFPIDSNTRFHVEGNASITLPEDANLDLHAIVGGEITCDAPGFSGGGTFVNLIYSEGAAKLNMNIQGDLQLLGPTAPRKAPYWG